MDIIFLVAGYLTDEGTQVVIDHIIPTLKSCTDSIPVILEYLKVTYPDVKEYFTTCTLVPHPLGPPL